MNSSFEKVDTTANANSETTTHDSQMSSDQNKTISSDEITSGIYGGIPISFASYDAATLEKNTLISLESFTTKRLC